MSIASPVRERVEDAGRDGRERQALAFFSALSGTVTPAGSVIAIVGARTPRLVGRCS